jgi:hypothetical protein
MRKFPWFFFLTLLPVVVLAEPLRIMTYNVWVGFDKKRTLEAGKAGRAGPAGAERDIPGPP